VWGQRVLGWDCGPLAADWFTRFLAERDDKRRQNEHYRLLYNAGSGMRNIDRKANLHVNDIKSSDQVWSVVST